MKVDGSVEVAASPQKLWELLQDPEFLKEVMPGCKDMKKLSEDEFVATIGAKVGAITSQYTTKCSIHDKEPPRSYRLHLEGEGKGGFVRGDIKMALEASDGGTTMNYVGDMTIGGTIARIGQRLIDSASKMLIKQGMKSLKKKVEEAVGA